MSFRRGNRLDSLSNDSPIDIYPPTIDDPSGFLQPRFQNGNFTVRPQRASRARSYQPSVVLRRAFLPRATTAEDDVLTRYVRLSSFSRLATECPLRFTCVRTERLQRMSFKSLLIPRGIATPTIFHPWRGGHNIEEKNERRRKGKDSFGIYLCSFFTFLSKSSLLSSYSLLIPILSIVPFDHALLIPPPVQFPTKAVYGIFLESLFLFPQRSVSFDGQTRINIDATNGN